ncbi:MAG: hypothetical protein E6778_21600 [Niallia nealsonii]|nr:hypothetical protein [Niallia nealsonii]
MNNTLMDITSLSRKPFVPKDQLVRKADAVLDFEFIYDLVKDTANISSATSITIGNLYLESIQ